MMSLLFVLLAGCTPSGDAEFHRGLDALREGDARAAVTALDASLEAGGRNPAVYHALGNSLYRLDRKGEAAVAWRRGLLLAPRDGDIAANLDHIRGQFRDRIDPPSGHRGLFFWQSQLALIESGALSSFAFTFAFFLGFLGRILRVRVGSEVLSSLRWSGRIAIVVGSLLLFSTVDAFYARQGAMITAPQVEVRSALGPAGVSLFILHEGAEVSVEDRTDTHQLIVLSDGRKGWVSASTLLSTDPAEPFLTTRQR